MITLQTILPIEKCDYWWEIHDGDPRLRAILDRHYSRRVYRDGRRPKKSIGPGEYMALITPGLEAIFAWRKFIDDSGQKGVNCAIFRNEGLCDCFGVYVKSSTLIKQAMNRAWKRWPGERLYTYVNPRMVRSSNPGCCFKKAGWQEYGKTKGGLLILEAMGEEGG